MDTGIAERGTPGCLSEALADLLDASRVLEDEALRATVDHGLRAILARRDEQGGFLSWEPGGRAGIGTRAIATTLCGLLACARGLESWDTLGAAARAVLERLAGVAECAGGHLPAAFDARWNVLDARVDPRANARLARALYDWSGHARDVHLAGVAADLVDVVCAAQISRHPFAGARGAVSERLSPVGQTLLPDGSTLAAVAHGAALLALLDHEQARPLESWKAAA
jgi:hypothetical protein